MKSNIRTLLYICLALPLFFSCEMKKDLFGGEEVIETETGNVGLLDLEIHAEKEASLPETKTDGEDVLDTDKFAISILDSLEQVVKHYASYATMKEEGDLLLPAGTYRIQASSGTDSNAAFDAPYYAGDTTCVISVKEVAKVVTNCSLQNKKIQFEFTDQFKREFQSDYTIVVDNGLGVLSIPSDETRTAYLKNTGTLRFSVYATTNDNKLCTYTVDMSKDSIVQVHNNVYIKLDADSVNPGTPDDGTDEEEPERPDDDPDDDDDDNTGDDDNNEPTNPDQTVTSPILKVDITLIEKDYVFTLPTDFTESKPDVDDNTGGSDDNTGGNTGGDDNNSSGGEDTSTQSPTITGTIDGKTFDVSKSQDVSNAKSVIINMYLPTGLSALSATITIGSDDPFTLDLLNYEGHALESVLDSMGLPKKGDKGNLKFDISAFLDMLSSSNSFKVTIKDANGKSASATIKLTK